MKKDFKKENRFKKLKKERKAKQEDLLWKELFEYIHFFKPNEIFNRQLLFLHHFDTDVAKRVAIQYNCGCHVFHPGIFKTVITFYDLTL